jgi:hypothetical protein
MSRLNSLLKGEIEDIRLQGHTNCTAMETAKTVTRSYQDKAGPENPETERKCMSSRDYYLCVVSS